MEPNLSFPAGSRIVHIGLRETGLSALQAALDLGRRDISDTDLLSAVLRV